MSTVVLQFPVAGPSRPHPLSSIRNPQSIGSSSKPLPLLPNASHQNTPRSRPSRFRRSSAYPRRMSVSIRVSIGSVLQEPRILANFLRYVHWPDFQSLALTCTTCRNVLHHPELRDAVLFAYVPGYQYCRRYAGVDSSKHVDVQFIDLIHFMASQQLALHHYPTLALATLSGSCEPAVLEEKIPRYVMLCQAHSRMVLLLQALIHSSTTPVPPELEDPSVRYRDTSRQSGRELVFPAPLSFFSNDGARKNNAAKQLTRRISSMPSAFGRVPRSSEGESMRRSLSRMSILGRNRVPLPPPSADPFGLKLYSGSWRRPRRSRASVMPSSTPDNDESLLRRPMRESVSPTDGNQSSSDNGTASPHSTVTESLPIPFTMHSPHDIRAATSRLRAPILRVYVPCSEVDHRAITACETQLEVAGLWQHLSVGDIVCNLGYLPPADVVGSSSSSDLSCDDTPAPEPRPESWLIFDGTGLLPYTPSAILPLSEPLSLPSPFYYAHITFPPDNPRFIATLPRGKPELSLDLLPARVRSPHSPDGFARIRKYVWVARLKPHVRSGLGERWRCEWILEGEGTKEGRQSLLDALRGDASAERQWQIVMERCTTARVWLRLMSITPPIT